jgi:uncharacterized protein YjiS (DUF1127 family)
MSNVATLSTSLPGQSGGPIHLLTTVVAYVRTRIERTRVTEHLSGLDNRLLADMGLARDDLAKLFR